MHNNSKRPHIKISPVYDNPGHYVAAFSSEVLGATFSVVFPATITGAVALHTFAEMVRGHYGHAVEISLPDPFGVSLSPPVQEIVATLERMHCLKVRS